MIDVFREVEQIVSPVYLVGGAVRDELLGVEPKDYDFSTPLLPDEIEAAVRGAGRKPYLIGKRFGTVGLTIDSGMPGAKYMPIEITTFREESYGDGDRHPHTVEFVKDITHDLSRRDFTINSCARRGGHVIDPFGGRDDLKAGVLRAVGIPSQRFKEDPLRILRLARFAGQLGFTPEAKTFASAKKLSYKLLHVSRERWVGELDKLLVSPHVEKGLDLLMTLRIMNYVIPELAVQNAYDQNTPFHDFELWSHTCGVVGASPCEVDLRWAALLHDVGKPYVRHNKPGRSVYVHHDWVGSLMAERICTYLRMSKERTKKIASLVLEHLSEDSPLRVADSGAQKRTQLEDRS